MWFEKFNCVVSAGGFHQCHSDHSVFIHSSAGSVVLAVYIDDILLTGSDTTCIEKVKELLNACFVIKNIRRSRYFLGIEISHRK